MNWPRVWPNPSPAASAFDCSMRTIAAPIFLAVSLLSAFTLQAHAQGGVPVWTNYYGNVFVTGSSYAYFQSPAYYATIKYSSAGVPLWTNLYHGPPGPLGPDAAFAIAVDSSGNVVVTGLSNGYGVPDYGTIKYSGAGIPLWTNRYDGPGDSFDIAKGVAVDGSGNVFVTGPSAGSAGNLDYATIKYSGAGAPVWTNRYNGPGNGNDVANAIAVDGNGNVFVTGHSVGSAGNFDYATIKYSAAGAPLWTNRYDGPANGHDLANAIAVDGNGNVLVSGYSTNTTGGYDYVTISYTSAGVPQWTNRYNARGSELASDWVPHKTLAVDRNGNVFVTGNSAATNGFFDYVTVAYSSAGAPLWTNRFFLGAYVYVYGVAVDPNGNVFVAAGDVALAYSGGGTLLWTNAAAAFAIAVDRNGNVFVTGGGVDYATVKYSLIPPPIHFQRVSSQFVLSWTTPAFSLQSAPAVTGIFTNIPGATSPYTNLITGQQRYFRLKGN
jgi:hypothetical protein